MGPTGRQVRSPKLAQRRRQGGCARAPGECVLELLQLSQEPVKFVEAPQLHPGITPHSFPRVPHFQQYSLEAAQPVTPVTCRRHCCAWNASMLPYRHPREPPSMSPARLAYSAPRLLREENYNKFKNNDFQHLESSTAAHALEVC